MFIKKAVCMGKYKQWLHHQEVGARLRDEMAAHEAERERVLKLAPTRPATLPDLSNPIIAALLGQGLVSKATAQAATQAAAKNSANGAGAAATPAAAVVEASGPTSAADTKTAVSAATSATREARTADTPVTTNTPIAEAISAAASPEDAKTSKAVKQKNAGPATNGKEKAAGLPAPVEASSSGAATQADTIDPLLEKLLAQAENAPADPLEALNLLASQGPNLTHGEAPQAIAPLPTAPLVSPAPGGQSALSVLMGETWAGAPSQDASATPVAVSAESIVSTDTNMRAEATARAEKGRSETDELIAARPTDGYTEPRLIVPQWLKSMELGQEQEGAKVEENDEDAEARQRFSVSLPFENEEDMRLHESVERWWQRWRQQS